MSSGFNRRSKVLLAWVVSMTLGSGLLLVLAPGPLAPAPSVPLMSLQNDASSPYLAFQAAPAAWARIVIHQNQAAISDYHFTIDSAGRIEATERWRQQKPTPSQADDPAQPLTLHVAVIGNFDVDPPSEVQLGALRLLAGQLAQLAHLDASRILLHRQLESVPCPGPAFPQQWMNTGAL